MSLAVVQDVQSSSEWLRSHISSSTEETNALSKQQQDQQHSENIFYLNLFPILKVVKLNVS